MKKPKIDLWETRRILPNITTVLYHDRKKLRKAFAARGIELPDLSDAPGQTFPVTLDGETVYVTLIETKDATLWQELSLLVHEAVHIAVRYFEGIGECEPAEEESAYVTQAISGCLIDAHLQWREGKRGK